MAGTNALGVRCLEDLPDLDGRAVLVRATLDLPFSGESESPAAALRTSRLVATLEYLAARAARVTVWGDLSRPGHVAGADHVRRIRETLEAVAPNVRLADSTRSAEDPVAIEELLGLHQAFVNDTFQWSYLPLPSLMVPPDRLPAACGRGLQRDLEIAERILHHPVRPFVAVLGGAHPSLRLHGLQGLVLRADQVLVGAMMSAPLLAAIGGDPYRSDTASPEFRSVIGLANRVRHPVEIPSDLFILRADGSVGEVPAEPDVDGEIVDIGPATVKSFSELVEGAGGLLWCGTLGEVEDPRFVAGTLAVARQLSGREPGTTTVGGDALTDVLARTGLLGADVDVISATDSLLELLKSGDLPALPPLRCGSS